jgi:hypothetical protein
MPGGDVAPAARGAAVAGSWKLALAQLLQPQSLAAGRAWRMIDDDNETQASAQAQELRSSRL